MCTNNSRWLFCGIMLTKHYPPITTAGPYLPCINLPCTHAGWGNTTKSYQIPTRNKGLKPYSSAVFLILFCYFLTHPGGVEKGTYIWIYICAHIHVSSHDHVYNIYIYIIIHLVLTVEKINISFTPRSVLCCKWCGKLSTVINKILLKRSRQRNVDLILSFWAISPLKSRESLQIHILLPFVCVIMKKKQHPLLGGRM